MLKNNANGMRSIVLFIACLASIIILFHTLFNSGFNTLLGDRFDALIQTNLLQHWFNVIQGHSKWDTVGYFYPFKNTLGYNDGYFLYGIIYSVFRFLGFDLFISTDLVNISLKVIGFYSFYYLTKKVLNFSFLAAVTGTLAFTFGNSMAVHMQHAQLLSIAFAPLLTIFIVRYFQALKVADTRKSLLNGGVSSLLLALWLFTSYYMAWYYILFFATSFIIFVFLSVVQKSYRDNLKIKISYKSLIFPALVFMIFIIPFLKVYLPKASETGGQSLFAVQYYAPSFYNVIDPGAYNYIFGKLTNPYFSDIAGLNRVGEFSIGLAPVSVIILLVSVLLLAFSRTKNVFNVFVLSLCLATIITAVCAIKFGDVFLWKYIWQYFPGAKGMRVTGRYFLFLVFPVVLVTTWFLDKLARKNIGLIFYALCLFLILEQVNFAPNAFFDRIKNKEFVSSVPVPPESCKAFYVAGQRKGEFPIVSNNVTLSLYPHNVDAMLISEVYKIRTINGFSTFNPPGWDFALYPISTYMARVQNYINNNKISDGMCEFDLENLQWTAYKADKPVGIVSRIYDKVDLKVQGIAVPDDKRKNYQVSILVTNNSGFNLGEGSFRPIKVGVKLYGAASELKNHDYMHIEIPHLPANKSETRMNITLPETFKPDDYISISLLEEGVQWFDWLDFKPIVVKL